MDYDATLKDGVRKHLKFSDSLQRSRSTNDSQVINALETRIQANQTDKAQASTTKSQSTQIRAYRFWRTSASALGFKRNERKLGLFHITTGAFNFRCYVFAHVRYAWILV